VLRKFLTATGVAMVLAAGAHSGVALARPAAVQAMDEARAEAAMARVETVSGLVNQSSSSLAGINARLLANPDDAEGMRALSESLERARVQAADAAAKLQALPAWKGDTDGDRLLDKSTKDATSFAVSTAAAITELQRLVNAARAGDKAAVRQGVVVLLRNLSKMIEGQALNARSRAALMTPGSSDREMTFTQANLYDGVAAAMPYLYGQVDASSTAGKVRQAQAAAQETIAVGRKRLDAEIEADRLEFKGAPPQALTKTHQIQTDLFASLARSVEILGGMADKIEAGGERTALAQDLTAMKAEEDKQQVMVREQIALGAQMVRGAR
jgi:hypothetical protein